MQDRGAVERLSAVGNEAPQGAESVGGYPIRMVCRPRILGSGRTGRYFYTDVRHDLALIGLFVEAGGKVIKTAQESSRLFSA